MKADLLEIRLIPFDRLLVGEVASYRHAAAGSG
jgi:hypothetical protein